MNRPTCATLCAIRSLALLAACTVALLFNNPAQAAPFSFDDIEYWVGSGANRAALVLDWKEGEATPPALAWGFRWDGTARGRDMLLAVLAADSRLFAKLGGTPASPNAVYGLGYDADGDGQFGVCDDGDGQTCFEQATFNSNGIAFTGTADGGYATDPSDYYAEGWFSGFWHYGIASANPYDGGAWTDFQFGMAGRVLADGAWDSWTLETTTVPPFNGYAENPTAAAAPDGLPGDFDHDNDVDGADYDVWRRAFGNITNAAVDANDDDAVNAADYVVWRKHAGASASGAGGRTAGVPEPSTAFLLLAGTWLANLRFHRSRKER